MNKTNNYPIKIARYHDPIYLPHGLRFKLSKVHKIDDHLYSFYINHPTTKYLDLEYTRGHDLNHVLRAKIEMIDYWSKGIDPDDLKGNKLRNSFKKGIIKGGMIKIRLFKPITDCYLKFIPMKWETLVLVIVSINWDLDKEED